MQTKVAESLRIQHLGIGTIAILVLSCGGAQEPVQSTEEPKSQPQFRNSMARNVSSAPQVTFGDVGIDCYKPECVTVSGLPAVSGMGTFAVATKIPLTLNIAGKPYSSHILRVDIVKLHSGKVRRSIDLVSAKDHELVMIGTLADCCDAIDGECDPSSCPSNARKRDSADKSLKFSFRDREKRLSQLLEGKWRALAEIPEQTAKDKTRSELYLRSAALKPGSVTVSVTDRKSNEQLGDKTILYSCPGDPGDCSLASVSAWADRIRNKLVIRVVSFASTTNAHNVIYATQRIKFR